MAKRRKSPAKAGRKKAAPKKTANKKSASKKSARRSKARAPTRKRGPATDPLDAMLEAGALALALPIEPDWRPAIKANLAVNLQMAALVAEFPLPDETDPAPIFRA